MTDEAPETIDIHQSIPHRYGDESVIGGTNYIDDQGRWAVRLAPSDASGVREIHLLEGGTFEFGGVTWQVSKIYEPRIGRRRVATLTRIA
jgi:hypothetical protein